MFLLEFDLKKFSEMVKSAILLLYLLVLVGHLGLEAKTDSLYDDDPQIRTVAVLRKEEMLRYLNYINQFYAVRGRARYGKRDQIFEEPTKSEFDDIGPHMDNTGTWKIIL